VPHRQLKDVIPNRTSFEEAFYNPDSWCRDNWQSAINKEVSKMEALQVWTPIIMDKSHQKETYQK
jgi:hypothetical protein